MTFLLRIEGVDFAATLADTDDLSTIRGASQAYLFMPERIAALVQSQNSGWKIEPVVALGASIGTFRVRAADGVQAAKIEQAVAQAVAAPDEDPKHPKLDAVRAHLSFAWAAVEEGGDYGADTYRLQARLRARQLGKLTVDVPEDAGAILPCHFDRKRPAAATVNVGGMPRRASASVKARHDYGAEERHRFYRGELSAEAAGLEVTRSLQDIIDPRMDLAKDARLKIPPGLQSKLAAIYFDGNSFTKIRDATVFGEAVPKQEKEERHRQFDSFVRTDKRRELLKRIVASLRRSPDRNEIYRDGHSRLRFETLMWGGDEALLVVPAWSLMELLPELMTGLEGWDWQDHALSHAVGVAVCNVKTPIAVIRQLAEEIAEEAKDKAVRGTDVKRLANAVAIQIFESVEPPREDLKLFRADLYGTDNPAAFALKGRQQVEEFCDIVRAFQCEPDGLTRSQLYGLIGEARRYGLLSFGRSTDAESFIDGRVRGVFERAKSAKLHTMLRNPVLGYTAQAPLLPLLRLAEFWDYVDPFGRASAVSAPGGASS